MNYKEFKMKHLLVAEQVGRGHPDKLADLISDTVLMFVLAKDKKAKVAVETLISGFEINIAGEIKTKNKINYGNLRKQIKKTLIEVEGIDRQYLIITGIRTQSPEINKQVVKSGTVGAGDQGIMLGYASGETLEQLPLEISLTNFIRDNLEFSRTGDIKVQAVITVDDHQLDITKVHIAFNTPNPEEYNDELVNSSIRFLLFRWRDNFVNPNLSVFWSPDLDITYVAFKLGGSKADAGVTGRKIVADAYGPRVPVGGGAFSGKDFSKVDRTGAYLARFIATEINAKNNNSKFIENTTVRVVYEIGQKYPLLIDSKTEALNNNKELQEYRPDNSAITEQYELMSLEDIFKLLDIDNFNPLKHNWLNYFTYQNLISNKVNK